MRDVAGKVIFVTGGASGIGLGVAEAFVEAGARVALADIDGDAAEQAARELRQKGGEAVGLALDVADPAAWNEVVSATERALGAVDVLCNSAGVSGALKPLMEIPFERIRRLMDINLFGVIHGVQCVVPRLQGRGGHVINIASMAGMDPVPTIADYSAAKFAVVALSECLAVELADQGVGVSVVCPGVVRTRLGERTAEILGEPLRDPTSRPAPTSRSIEPIVVGRIILEGVQNNRLHVFTHPENRPRIERRFERVLRGFDALG